MIKRNINIEKVISISQTLLILLFLILNIYNYINDIDSTSLLPYPNISLIIIHSICLLASIILIFTNDFQLEFVILQIESIASILSNFPEFGIFLFYSSIFILDCKELFNKQNKKMKIIFLIFHFLILCLTFLKNKMYAICFIMTSFFYYLCFRWFAETLRIKLSCILPVNTKNNDTIGNIKPGKKITLSDYDLTERQINFILEYMEHNLTYKQISEKYYVSISTVKKEFSDIFKVFNITKLEELHILLLQYQIVR